MRMLDHASGARHELFTPVIATRSAKCIHLSIVVKEPNCALGIRIA